LKKALVVLALGLIGLVFIYAIGRMPPMNSKATPDKTHVVPRYVQKGEQEAGARNIITGIILNYRGYDTMGVTTVIFSALAAVIALLDREKRRRSRSRVDASEVHTSLVVRTVARFTTPVVVMFAVYTILHGEPSAGGGFQGGAVIGASIIVFALVWGLPESTDRMRLGARLPLESSAMIAFLAMGVIGLAYGVNFLTFILPGLSSHAAETVRSLMLTVIEAGIGVGGGIIFISIVFAMLREDRLELQPDRQQL
jgi:multicomponent Na+:H+ antiporter subunit B